MSENPGVVKLYTFKRNGGFSNSARFPAALARLLTEKYDSPEITMHWEMQGDNVVLKPDNPLAQKRK